jgi:hypothetical protein
MTIEDISKVIGAANIIFLIVVSIVGAIWAYYKFKRMRALKKALALKILPTIFHHEDWVVVEVVVEFINSGTIPVYVLPENLKECVLRVKTLPMTDEHQLLELNSEECSDIVDPIQYLSQYEPTHKTPITLEPGVPAEVHGYGIFVTKYQGLLLVHAEFYDRDGIPWTEGKIINTAILAA